MTDLIYLLADAQSSSMALMAEAGKITPMPECWDVRRMKTKPNIIQSRTIGHLKEDMLWITFGATCGAFVLGFIIGRSFPWKI